ncbi:40270_t:CDS:1, partial [Gigaspora margarita]
QLTNSKDQKWTIVTQSSFKDVDNDIMEGYSHQAKKYLNIMDVDDYQIICYQKERFFDDYVKSKGISGDEMDLFLCFMNFKTEAFRKTLINNNYKDWQNKYTRYFQETLINNNYKD